MAKAAAMLVALTLVVVVVATSAGGASADLCNGVDLFVCEPAVIGGSTPTPACCSNLRAQEDCFCQFARDPAYSVYVDSNNPDTRRTLAYCNIAFPIEYC